MLNEDGQLVVPLYHGTSSYYVDSIKEFGLGGIRDEMLFDKNILSALAEKLDNPSNQTEWWELHSIVVARMLEQRITSGGFNFRHGGTYLSPSRFTARNYATSNRMGSEYISTIEQAFTALASVNGIAACEIIPAEHRLRSIFDAEHSPVVISARGLSAEMLSTENGESVESQLASMRRLKDSVTGVDPEELWQQFNFEIRNPIQASLLEIEYITN